MMSDESTYLKRLKEWLVKDPDSRLFLSLAEEYWKRDVTDVAIGLVEEGLKRHPDFDAARECLASWYLSKDRPLDGELQLVAIVERNPDILSAQRRLARLRRRLGKTEEALSGYRHIAAMRPHDAEARRALEETLARTGSETEPEADRPQGACDSSGPPPGSAIGRLSEAESAFSAGQHSRALELYTAVLAERAEIWQIVQRRDEAQRLLHAAQRERKRLAVDRLGRLREAVRDQYADVPESGLPPASDRG